MKKYLSAVAASCILSITFCGCGNNSSNTASSKTPAVTTIGTVSDSIEKPETDDILSPDTFSESDEAASSSEVVSADETDAYETPETPGENPSGGGIGAVINQPSGDADAVKDDVEMWVNGDGTFTYSLAWRQIWLTCSTNIFDNIFDGIRGPYFDERVPAERFGWSNVAGATYTRNGDDGSVYVLKPNEMISGSPTGTSAYAGIYYSKLEDTFSVYIRVPDASLSTYEFYASSGVWNLDNIIFFSYMCEAASENPETDMFADIIPDYFEIYHGGGGDMYDILYQSIRD